MYSPWRAFPWLEPRRAVSLSLLVSCLFSPLLLDGCAFVPSTGPFASNVLDKKSNSIPVENANENIARQLWQETLYRNQENIDKTLAALGQPAIQPLKIAVGDSITLSLWSQSVGSSQQSILQTAPHETSMGVYTVALNGTVDLPYVGPVTVAGLMPQEADKIIAARYAQSQQFPKAEAVVTIKHNKGQHVVIIGSVNKPITLDWPEGGLTISEALASAGGF
ncbi:MAG: polysaccharide biosynthesis/export family protein, partial [Acetobacter sp.]|nr:polysaccharide biosynthesis/export family protein [Acetobacter sp.]